MIAACLLSYGIGNMLINVVTLFIRSGDGIVIFTAVLITLGFFPIFFGMIRSPKFLYKQGRVGELGGALVKISGRNKTGYLKEDFYQEIVDDEVGFELTELDECKIRVKLHKKDQKESSLIKKELLKFGQLFTNFEQVLLKFLKN